MKDLLFLSFESLCLMKGMKVLGHCCSRTRNNITPNTFARCGLHRMDFRTRGQYSSIKIFLFIYVGYDIWYKGLLHCFNPSKHTLMKEEDISAEWSCWKTQSALFINLFILLFGIKSFQIYSFMILKYFEVLLKCKRIYFIRN